MKPHSTVQKVSGRGHEILNSKNLYTWQFKDTHYLKAFSIFPSQILLMLTITRVLKIIASISVEDFLHPSLATNTLLKVTVVILRRIKYFFQSQAEGFLEYFNRKFILSLIKIRFVK